ncbi:hypothetical protein TrLO_g1853 [Triparma laevis f. longispina]|uniref:Uncharacterized protein n=1 Tax=Triparma laevis f. longispina TaxID=1714387 RepID=A0A9W7A7N9_9STRA|nr:hypothetical protein TrLO_g1853 [Triparma laevis f. longispina]
MGMMGGLNGRGAPPGMGPGMVMGMPGMPPGMGMPMNMMPMPMPMMGGVNAQAEALGNMDLGAAQKMFLKQAQAAKADPTVTRTWGPGGVGGISTQKTVDSEHEVVLVDSSRSGGTGSTRGGHNFYDDYDDDRFGPGYSVNRQNSTTNGESKEKRGKFYQLMDAAEKQAEKMVGQNMYGRGLSVEEGRKLDKRWNEEDAMAKYIFASQKVAGGYLATARKQKFKRRQRELLRAKEERFDREEEEEAGSSPIKLSVEKPKTTVDMFTRSGEKKDNKDDDKDEGDESSSSSSSSSSEEEDARRPIKSAPTNDAKTRQQRRTRRKDNAAVRSHRIMEMDPSALNTLRQSIRNRREEEKKKRLEMAKENRDLQNSVIPPPPPDDPNDPGADDDWEHEGGATSLEPQLNYNGPVTVANLMKQHRTVVSSVKQNLETDLTLGKNTISNSQQNWVKPPPPPNTYTGFEKGEAINLDTGETTEWRSETRADDLKKAHEGFTKITHAKTLVDVINTISDLRDDIEKVKNDKRRIITALRKLEKQLKNNAVKGDDSGRQEKEINVAKKKLAKSKDGMDKQQEEMEEMLAELQDSRKRLMDGEKEGGGETTDFGSDSAPEQEEEEETVGGLDGLRERRRKRNEGKSSPRATPKKKKSAKSRVLEKLTVSDTVSGAAANSGPHKAHLEALWSSAQSTSLASGASAEIQTNKDGCPLYYKLLLNIESPKNVTEEQRSIYTFLKQSSIPEQVSFIKFALDPQHSQDLLPSASAFLKIHAHSYKSIQRFKTSASWASPHIIQLLTCAAESYHVAYLSPVLALLWLFAKVPSNRSIMLRNGVVGVCVKRLRNYSGKRSGVGKRKGKGKGLDVKEQSLCALTLLSGVCFE